jgi:hypothetical protein
MAEQKDTGYLNFVKTKGSLEYIEKFNIDKNQYSELIYKLCTSLSTQKDVDDFFKFLTALYSAGYQKSAEDHRTALEKHGIKFNFN